MWRIYTVLANRTRSIICRAGQLHTNSNSGAGNLQMYGHAQCLSFVLASAAHTQFRGRESPDVWSCTVFIICALQPRTVYMFITRVMWPYTVHLFITRVLWPYTVSMYYDILMF